MPNWKQQTYSEFRPTSCDAKGLALPDRQAWIVAPVSRTRDSGTLEESNFAVVLADLGGESDTVEVHRFGHWGPGWFEIIIVHPSRSEDVAAWEAALADYPVASEDDWSERQRTAACEAWANMSIKWRVELHDKYGFHLMACRRDELPNDESGELVSYLADGV